MVGLQLYKHSRQIYYIYIINRATLSKCYYFWKINKKYIINKYLNQNYWKLSLLHCKNDCGQSSVKHLSINYNCTCFLTIL